MEGMELACFEIISNVGAGKSCYINAIQKAKEGLFEEAQNLIKEGDMHHAEGHKAHVDMLQREAAGMTMDVSLLLVHAEDQMMSSETFKVLAQEFIELYQTIQE